MATHHLDSSAVINGCSIARDKGSQEIKQGPKRELNRTATTSSMILGNVYAFISGKFYITIQRNKSIAWLLLEFVVNRDGERR